MSLVAHDRASHCFRQVDPSRPGGMRFRDPFAQRLPRALPYGAPPPLQRLDGGPYSPPPSQGNDVEAADVEDALDHNIED